MMEYSILNAQQTIFKVNTLGFSLEHGTLIVEY
jgi:hypothetical protein